MNNTTYLSYIEPSAYKTSYIDLPVYIIVPYMLGAPITLQQNIINNLVVFTTYNARSIIKNEIMLPMVDNEYFAAATAGIMGGAFKYYLTGQNPIIGSLNIMSYELCNLFDSCANDAKNNILFTTSVETIDFVSQFMLSQIAAGNQINAGAVFTNTLQGMAVGAVVSFCVHDIYVPLVTGESGFTSQILSDFLFKE
jgi:hypothetical protein